MRIEVKGQHFNLLPQKAVFWEDEHCLIISDLHLGKSHHFRRAGVAVPKTGDLKNLSVLKGLIAVYKPERILLLGDLFHSEHSSHVSEVKEWIKSYASICWHLVRGNHDILDDQIYEDLGLHVVDEELEWGPFLFRHEPVEDQPALAGQYVISGHLHPGIRLRGKGRQALTLPCFYFGTEQAVMPAFGHFTGLFRIAPKKGDRLFCVTGQSVIPL